MATVKLLAKHRGQAISLFSSMLGELLDGKRRDALGPAQQHDAARALLAELESCVSLLNAYRRHQGRELLIRAMRRQISEQRRALHSLRLATEGAAPPTPREASTQLPTAQADDETTTSGHASKSRAVDELCFAAAAAACPDAEYYREAKKRRRV